MAPWSIPTPCCSCGSGFETSSFVFFAFIFFAFSWLWTTAAATRNRVPGGVPVDGIRVAGGPPVAPADLVWGSRVPNGITSGWDQGAAGIKVRSTYRTFLFFSPLKLVNMYLVPIAGPGRLEKPGPQPATINAFVFKAEYHLKVCKMTFFHHSKPKSQIKPITGCLKVTLLSKRTISCCQKPTAVSSHRRIHRKFPFDARITV